jgi:hypothetical protein
LQLERREKGVIASSGSKAGTETVHGLARRIEMLDTFFLVAGMAFFAMAVAYVAACEKL